MNEQSAHQLRLKPCGFRRHNLVRICDIHKVVKSGRIHLKCNFHILVYSPLKLAESSDTADEINPLVGTGIVNAEDWGNNIVLKN